MSGIEVDSITVMDAGNTWRGLAQDLQAAAEGLTEASTSGFDSESAPVVREFLEAWSGSVSGMETAADQLEEDLHLALNSFHRVEMDVVDVLNGTAKELE